MKHGVYSPFFPLQNEVCFIILSYLVPVLFAFYVQRVLKLKNNSGSKRLMLGLYVGLKKYNEYLEMVKASRVASISVTVDFKHISQDSGSRFLFF